MNPNHFPYPNCGCVICKAQRDSNLYYNNNANDNIVINSDSSIPHSTVYPNYAERKDATKIHAVKKLITKDEVLDFHNELRDKGIPEWFTNRK